MISKKHIPQWKLDEIDYLVEMFQTYKNIGIIEVATINDKQIQETRKLLRGKAIIRMSKKNLQLRAIEEFKKKSNKPNLDNLATNIPGQSALVFTNLDIFDIMEIFIKNKWMIAAKPGSVTTVDIWVPAGDTGLPTGQVISELNMTLKLPTRIQNDTIWVREDTQTHKAGDYVEIKQAAVLKKLGVTPLESVIKLHYAWSDGEVIPKDVLYMDIVAFEKDVITAYRTAQKLAIDIGIVDENTLEPIIQKANREALALLFELPIFIENMMDDYIKKAELNANILSAMVLGQGTTAAEEKKESKPQKEEKEEVKTESTTGIGGLFG